MTVQVRRENDKVLISQGSVASGETRIVVRVGDVPALVEALVRVSGERDAVVAELERFGVDIHVARQLAGSVTLSQVRGWVSYVEQAQGLRNPRGFLVARLRAGEWAPSSSRRRFLGGEYADYIEG
jgi:hypothetical protein